MQHIVWEEWEQIPVKSRHARRKSAVHAQTGYDSAVLEVLWESAKEFFVRTRRDNVWVERQRSKWRAQHYFYVVLM